MTHALGRFLRRPLDDYLAALHVCLYPTDSEPVGARRVPVGRLFAMALALIVAWWIYVPIHELAHAFGCLLSGGEVTRLEIAPLHGAALLSRLFPFVTAGSEYAGRLTGFDTRGNDLIYLATDFAPFLLTILVGVPWLRCVGQRRSSCGGRAAPFFFGAALPVAFAPFLSLTGDYYEMGSILVSRCVALWSPAFPLQRWRSDDVFRLVATLSGADSGLRVTDAIGIGVSLLLGIALAFATYAAGGGVAARSVAR